MFIELLSILCYLLPGTIIAQFLGIKGWVKPFIGFIIGISLFITIGLLQVVTPLPTWPLLTMIALLASPVLLWYLFFRDQKVHLNIRSLLIVVVSTSILVFLFRSINLVTWSTDSYGYLASSILLGDNQYELSAINTITKRSLGTPLAHAPAQLGSEFYLQSLAPILSISVLAIITWFLHMRFYPKVTKDKWLVYGGACLAILLLATNHRYVFNSFYVNGHLLLSSQILVIVACGWLLNTNGLKSSQTMLIQLQTLVIPAAIITRPEATLVILLVLLPTLLLDKLSWKLRAIPLVVAGLSTILWQSFIAVQYIARGQQVPVEVIGFLLVASVAIVSIKLLNIRWLKNRARQILISIELGLWAVFAAFSIASPSIASRSLRSIYHNVVLGEGLWGLSLVVLGYFALVLMLLTRDKSLISLRFPITAFLPLMLIIAYLIDGAYRVGAGDSFNRMLLHILPLLVLYIVVATISLLLIHQPGERKRQSS